MTTRLIEECLDIERRIEEVRSIPMIFNSRILSREEVKKIMNAEPGQIIKLSPLEKKCRHAINYGGDTDVFRNPSA